MVHDPPDLARKARRPSRGPELGASCETPERSSAAADHASQVLGAGVHVGHRALAAGFLGENGVLLEDVPAVVALPAQVPDDRSDIDIPAAEGAVHAVTDRLGVGAPPELHLAGQAEVDVLHLCVGDLVRYLPGKFGGIRGADEQVTGVQAQADGRALKHPLHSSPFSIIVPTCGCSTARTSCSAVTASILSRLASRVAQPCSSKVGRVS